MSELQIVTTYAVFAAVILAIAFNILDLALAGLLGVSVLIVFGILTQGDIINVVKMSGSTFALLFGGMIVARTLTTSGIFEFLGALFLERPGAGASVFFWDLSYSWQYPACSFRTLPRYFCWRPLSFVLPLC